MAVGLVVEILTGDIALVIVGNVLVEVPSQSTGRMKIAHRVVIIRVCEHKIFLLPSETGWSPSPPLFRLGSPSAHLLPRLLPSTQAPSLTSSDNLTM